ncbi:MAG: hypothetical protein PHF35_01225 [Candidatus Moranbacteria bacterium]|nr:hypothetical protein [Candidatus Moranbacteria bacterium]
MSLQETERKIYKRPEENPAGGLGGPMGSSSQKPAESPFFASSFGASDLEKKQEDWARSQEEKKTKRKRAYTIAAIITGAVLLAAGGVWLALYIRKTSFSADQVKVSLSGPEKVMSGESVSIDISYQNLNRASLGSAVLYVSYSENFQPAGNLQFEVEGPTVSKFNVGSVSGKSSGKVTIQGKFFGATDALVYVKAKLEYKPSVFNSTFAAEGTSNVFIVSSPINIEVGGPQNAADGNAVSYVATYQNTGQTDFNDLKIKADFPEGFSFSNSDPLPAQENIWYVGTLAPGQSGKITISGKISGARDQQKSVKISIGQIGSENSFIAYAEAESSLKIIGSPLALNVEMNGKSENSMVSAGDSLMFRVGYRNAGEISLRDAILSVDINSPILDYGQVDMLDRKGEFDSGKKTITWKASDIPAFKTLAPGDSGYVSFSVPVKNIIPVSSSNDKNFSFSAVAYMDSPDIPTSEGANKIVASNSLTVKLNSKLLVDLQGFYNDSEIQNTGELPLKVGQETTFTLHLKVSNVSNDITDARVTMTLGPGVSWKSNFIPNDASMSYNGRTNELVWNIGSLSAGTGIITDPRELIFQLGVTPSQNQTSTYPTLISSTVFSAKDAFTGQASKVELGGKSTNLTEDLSVGDAGRVEE